MKNEIYLPIRDWKRKSRLPKLHLTLETDVNSYIIFFILGFSYTSRGILL